MHVVNLRTCLRLAAYVFIFVAALQSKAVAQNNETGTGAGDKPVSHPVCIHCPPPEFPLEARRAKIESGDVSLGITVSEKGRVSDIHVLSDPGHGFAKEAVAAVKHWRFKPAVTKDGRKVSMYLPVLVSSRLMPK
jgi:TonB family protein